VIKDSGFAASFPKRILGRTGVVESMRGNFAVVKLNEGNNPKTFIIHPIHLKKLKQEKK
jgi:ribosomal protein L21E